MATSLKLLRSCVWLLDTIRGAQGITLKKINELSSNNATINENHEPSIPARTFHRYCDNIADIFGVDIYCNRSDNTYYIANPEALEGSSFFNSIFKWLSISNQLLDHPELKNRIIYEKALKGEEYLSTIIKAFDKCTLLSITYQRFDKSAAKTYTVEPYLLKQWQRRLYLLVRYPDTGTMRTLALDRVKDMTLLDETFKWDPAIDVSHYFDEVIGTTYDEEYDCEDVTVKVFGNQRAYIEALPLHHSQQIVGNSHDGYTIYRFHLRPEFEFQRELLRMGPDAEVVSPEWLREEMKYLAQQTLERYATPPAADSESKNL